jgi:hypothetical protein
MQLIQLGNIEQWLGKYGWYGPGTPGPNSWRWCCEFELKTKSTRKQKIHSPCQIWHLKGKKEGAHNLDQDFKFFQEKKPVLKSPKSQNQWTILSNRIAQGLVKHVRNASTGWTEQIFGSNKCSAIGLTSFGFNNNPSSRRTLAKLPMSRWLTVNQEFLFFKTETCIAWFEPVCS